MRITWKQSYIWLLELIFCFDILITYTFFRTFIGDNYSQLFFYVSSGFFLVFNILWMLFNKRKFSNLLFIVLIIVFVGVFRKKEIFFMCMMAVSLLCLNKREAVNVYKWGILDAVLISAVASTLGVISNRSTIDNVLSFGFTNENTIGAYLGVLSILFVLRTLNGRIVFQWNWKNVLFFLFVFVMNQVVFGDRTMLIFQVVLIIGYAFQRGIEKNRIIHFIIIMLPTILTLSSYWMGEKFGTLSILTKINELLSSRLLIWNYYLVRYPVSLFGNKLYVVTTWSADFTPGQGAFDGSYIYMLYIFGVLFTVCLILGLTLTNYKLIKTLDTGLLIVLLAIEVTGVSENVLVSYLASFGTAFALLGYHTSWFSMNLDGGQTVEQN